MGGIGDHTVSACHLSSGLMRIMRHTWINILGSHSQDLLFFASYCTLFLLAVTLSLQTLLQIYENEIIFCFCSLFPTLPSQLGEFKSDGEWHFWVRCFDFIGTRNFLTWRVRDDETGAGPYWGSEPRPLILLEHFQKLHILAAKATKSTEGLCCSFIAGGRKEIKGFGPVSLTAWYNFVQCAEANSVFSVG